MKLQLSTWTKILLTAACFGIAVVGFMLKLPSQFRYVDKQLHTAFYFIAAAFLNLLFAKRKLAIHIFIFIFLYFFGVCIEHAQAYSNKLFHARIHSRYDKADVAANLKGLVGFSILWLTYAFFCLFTSRQNNPAKINISTE